jgi:predicted metal-dependent peptidase
MLKDSFDSLLMTFPEMAPGLLRLQPVEDNTIETACTDGKHLYYNPDFVANLDVMQRDFLVLHEVFHCLFGHLNIEEWRDPYKANIAQDFEINLSLVSAGFKQPNKLLFDMKYKGLCWQEIYDMIPTLQVGGCKGCGGVIYDLTGKGITEEEKQKIKKEWQQAAADYIELAKRVGRLPGGMEVQLNRQNELRPSIEAILRPYLKRTLFADHYTYRRLKRRGLALGIILPGTQGHKRDKIVVCIDLSGSMNEKELDMAWGIIGDLTAQHHSKWRLVAGDTEVTYDEELADRAPLPDSIKMKGRGGTDFAPLIEAAKMHRPAAILFFTDLFGTFGDNPNIPIHWITHTETIDVPFGSVCILPKME